LQVPEELYAKVAATNAAETATKFESTAKVVTVKSQ